MSDTSLGERLNRVLIALTLMDVGPVVDYAKEHISTGTGGIHAHRITDTTSVTATGAAMPVNRPPRPPAILWQERFLKMIEAAETYVDAELHAGRTRLVGTTTGAGARLSAHIQDYAGHPAEFVAFCEGCKVEAVREERRKLHLRMDDGTKYERDEALHTAPVEHVLEALRFDDTIEQVASVVFYKALHAVWDIVSKNDTDLAHNLTEYSVDELDQMRCYLSCDKLTGVCVRGDEIINLFNAGSAGRGVVALRHAIRVGGRRLDCFVGKLVDYYTQLGFGVVRYESNWTPGGPDVAFMELL